jgi:hypothetical protein
LALKLMRPGFGPALKRLVRCKRRGVTPADITLTPLNAACALHPSRRSRFGTWALAAQLNA